MVPAARRPLLFSALAVVLLAAFFLQSFLASRIKSPAWDETGDIAAGLSYWRTGKFTVNLQHPPLLKELSGLFLLATGARWPDTPEARQLLAGWSQHQWSVGSDIIKTYGQEKVMFWARLPMILVATGLGIVLYLWGRRMLGAGAALGALFLYAFDPTVLAHSYLVTLDVGLAAFTLLFCFSLWLYLRDPSLRRMLWCGAAMGAMLATKFSAPVVLPVAGLLLFVAVCRPPVQASGLVHRFFDLYAAAAEPKTKAGPNDPCPCGSGKKFKKCHGVSGQTPRAASGATGKLAVSIGAFLALCAVAVVVIEATYFFSVDPFLYIRAMRLVNQDHTATYLYYLAGSVSPRFLTYFAAAYLLKEPVATIALVLAGLVTMLRSTKLTLLDKLFLTLPPAALFVAHTFLADDMGIRYIIPVMAFAYLIGGIGLAQLLESGVVWKRILAAALCAWLIVAAIGIYPDHLSYFNETACLLTHPGEIGLDGGSRCGTYWLEDSNVDWGEGLKQLRAWLDRHAPGRKIRLAYLGSYPPSNYGLVYDDVGLEGILPEPAPGLYVVSAHVLIRAVMTGEMEDNHAGAWLRRIPPTAIVGHCLYIYDIPGK